jgi:cytosine/creatinine deaminase
MLHGTLIEGTFQDSVTHSSVFDMISTFPARAMGSREHGLREGARADLVLFEAQSAPEVLLHQAARAIVFKNGKVVAEAGRPLW